MAEELLKLTPATAARLLAALEWVEHFNLTGAGVTVTSRSATRFSAFIPGAPSPPPPPRQPRNYTFAVQLVEDGTGADGTDSTAPTYTYDVWRLDQDPETDDPIATGLSPKWAARTYGSFTAAERGLACYDETGAISLEIAYESPAAYACPTE